MPEKFENLVRNLYTYVNYEVIQHDAEEKGCVMKEAKDFYEFLILRDLEQIFKGKSKEEIARMLASLL